MNAFIFQAQGDTVYRVSWDGKQSLLYARLRSGHWQELRPVRDEQELDGFMSREIPPADYDRFDHRVEKLGRKFFMVKSESRPDVCHVVDFEANAFAHEPACSCEQNRFRKVKCKHLESVEAFLLAQIPGINIFANASFFG